MSEVRGRSQEDPIPTRRRPPRGATPRPRSGAAAKSARLQQYKSSREELPHNRGQGQRPGEATPRLRPGVAAGRSYPTHKEWWLCGRRRA